MDFAKVPRDWPWSVCIKCVLWPCPLIIDVCLLRMVITDTFLTPRPALLPAGFCFHDLRRHSEMDRSLLLALILWPHQLASVKCASQTLDPFEILLALIMQKTASQQLGCSRQRVHGVTFPACVSLLYTFPSSQASPSAALFCWELILRWQLEHSPPRSLFLSLHSSLPEWHPLQPSSEQHCTTCAILPQNLGTATQASVSLNDLPV